MKKLLCVLISALLLLGSTALAETPDLMGKWIGTFFIDSEGLYPLADTGAEINLTFNDPNYETAEYFSNGTTYNVQVQDIDDPELQSDYPAYYFFFVDGCFTAYVIENDEIHMRVGDGVQLIFSREEPATESPAET